MEKTLKFVQFTFFVSLIIFILAWSVPNLPWRPKRIEDYLIIYRMIFEAFRTWSMVSTAFTTVMILTYFAVTGAYNWRRQYTQSTKNQKEELVEDVSENERLWEEIRSKKIRGKKMVSGGLKELETKEEMKEFLEGIKVFEYLESGPFKQILEGVQLKSIKKDEKLLVNKTDLVFVTFGSFKSTFIDVASKANGLAVTCRRGQTLTSYSNVMRALAHFYNKTSDKVEGLGSISSVAQEDSQVLILNEACFVGLAQVSKLSVAHLTQVILSRFKRATIPIVFDYFNLTGFASSFLRYFIKKSNGFNDVKLAELLTCFQETFKTEEKLLKVILQYLIGAFDLEHGEFIPMETSLALLQNHIQIKTCGQNEVIQGLGEECKGAFLVLEGNLKISFSNETDGKCIEASVGDFVGIISSLMGKCSSIQVKGSAKSGGVTYAVISQHLLEMISERDPKILFANIPDNRNTSQFIEFLDMCIDWQQLGSGETVDTEKGIIKILHGRVREFKGQVQEVERHQRELGSGSFLREQEIFSHSSHPDYQYYTVRQTEIASFPADLIEGLVTASSEVSAALLPKLLARQKEEERNGVDPIKTICLLPVGVDYKQKNTTTQKLSRDNQTRLTEGVAEYLQRTLKRHQTTFTVIDGTRANELMGRQLFTTLGTLKMNEFLSSQEDVSKLIIYVADGIFSNWTKQCISQADLVLLIADLDDEVVEFGDLEKQMLQMNPLINVEICLLSSKNNRIDSRKWIKHRPWLKAHYHLSVPGYAAMITSHNAKYSHYNANILNMMPMDLFNNILRKSRDLLSRPRNQQRRGSVFMAVEREDEIEMLGFGRLVRRILGRSIGLVLGGGGARGLAHLGIFKAFKEAGIQVDLIGGTSIGAFIGGLLAKEGLENYSKVVGSTESFCKAMSSKWRQALDLTYPATSWFTGHAFNRALWKHFGFTGIEDFSVPFFAVTTDLTRSRLQLHRSGPAWKYVRASMSLSGFLPPVCDARDGTLLVDGGYLANVPIELMLRGALTELSELTVKNELSDERRDALSASIVVAIDVGRASDRVPIFYGDSLNGWSVIFKKFLKYFKKTVSVNLPLTLDEIQFRLAYASSAGLLSRTLKRSHVQLAKELNEKTQTSFVTVGKTGTFELPEVIYLRPSGVQQYGTLEFNKYKEIIKLGYDYGKRVIEEWRECGMLSSLLKYQGISEKKEEMKLDSEDIEIAVRCRRSSI